MYHLDARIQTALAREHAERLRQTMHAGRRSQNIDRNNVDQSGAARKEPASFLRRLGSLQRAAL